MKKIFLVLLSMLFIGFVGMAFAVDNSCNSAGKAKVCAAIVDGEAVYTVAHDCNAIDSGYWLRSDKQYTFDTRDAVNASAIKSCKDEKEAERNAKAIKQAKWVEVK
jgi:hypothetical protein